METPLHEFLLGVMIVYLRNLSAGNIAGPSLAELVAKACEDA